MKTATPSYVVQSVAGLARVPGHAEALAFLMRKRYSAPFVWGSHDCCLWAADAIAAQVGVDPAAQLRGRYATELQAWRVIRSYGTLEGIARAALGQQLNHPMHACDGDVGLVEGATVHQSWPHALAVCVGGWWVLPSAQGLTLRPMQAASMAWRVGCA